MTLLTVTIYIYYFWYVFSFHTTNYLNLFFLGMSLSLLCLGMFIIYFSCEWVFLPLNLYYICFCIDIFVHNIPVFSVIFLTYDKCFEVPVMVLFIRYQMIKNRIFSIYTINTLWYTFNFRSLWWSNNMDNINTKLMMHFFYYENPEIRIASSSLTSTRNYRLRICLIYHFLKAVHIFITPNVSWKR